ncbi:MAG: EamA family transporter [Actinomycetota bacterium]|jgi:drug/metabolite transporter (DMT)-like permease|nr:EamA family transporter [Actinomycetota bacterium]
MDGVALALVLSSALMHAGWNLLHHRSTDRVATIAFAYFFGGAVMLPAAFIDPPTDVIRWIALTLVFHTTYQVLLAKAFDSGGLSITYPIARGVSPLLVTIGGWWWLDQKPSTSTIVGVLLITVGLLSLANLGRQLTQMTAVGFAALTGLTITGYSLVDARAISGTSPVAYFSVVAFVAGLIVMAIAGVDATRIREVWKPGVVIGAAQASGYILVLYAFQRAQAAQVASLRQLSVVIGVLVAGEVARRKAFTAAALIALGSFALAA